MGKDFMSPKEIANRIKAKGLQKLRFFCQMCQKQCRDENGFKCHMMSESHSRMMGVFADSPDKFMTDFSSKFERGYMDIVKRRYFSRRVHSNVVYNEYIQDKQHVHMNSTIWPTLTDFVKYLGRTGKCNIEETERGWFIEYINRDPVLLRRQEEAEKRRAVEMDDAVRHEAELDAMVATAQALHGKDGEDDTGYTEFKREEGAEKVKVVLSLRRPAVSKAGEEEDSEESNGGEIEKDGDADDDLRHTAGIGPGPGDEGYEEYVKSKAARSGSITGVKRPRSAQISAFADEEDGVPPVPPNKKANSQSPVAVLSADAGPGRSDPAPAADEPWLLPGIVVRIMNKKLGEGRYYKQKACVKQVIEGYVGLLQLIDGGDLLKMDQQELETVIPSEDNPVLILKGRYRGCPAKLRELHVDRYCATLEITSGSSAGTKLKGVEYEDFSKTADVSS